jgi:hypothetical protein
MHARKIKQARFWRVFGWFVACFTGFLPETPCGRFGGAYNYDVMLNCNRVIVARENFPHVLIYDLQN